MTNKEHDWEFGIKEEGHISKEDANENIILGEGKFKYANIFKHTLTIPKSPRLTPIPIQRGRGRKVAPQGCQGLMLIFSAAENELPVDSPLCNKVARVVSNMENLA